MHLPDAALSSFDSALSAAHQKHDVRVEGIIRISRADALLSLGRLTEAHAEINQVRNLARGYETANRRALLIARNVEARLSLAEGNLSAGRQQIDELLRVLRENAGDTYRIASALIAGSQIAFAGNRFEDAVSMAAEALSIDVKSARKPKDTPVLPHVILLPNASRMMLPAAVNLGVLDSILSILNKAQSDAEGVRSSGSD